MIYQFTLLSNFNKVSKCVGFKIKKFIKCGEDRKEHIIQSRSTNRITIQLPRTLVPMIKKCINNAIKIMRDSRCCYNDNIKI